MAIVSDILFWTSMESTSIRNYSIHPGVPYEKKPPGLDSFEPNVDLSKVRLVSSAHQQIQYSFCLSGKHHCAHLCLFSAHSYSCACADGFQLDPNGFDCHQRNATFKPARLIEQIGALQFDFGGLIEESDEHCTKAVKADRNQWSTTSALLTSVAVNVIIFLVYLM